MNEIKFSDLSNIHITFTKKCGVEHRFAFEYEISLSSKNEVNKKYNLGIYPSDKLHFDIKEADVKKFLTKYFKYHKFIEIDEEYFNSIYNKLLNINFTEFSNVGEIYDVGCIEFEIRKYNYHLNVKYSELLIRESFLIELDYNNNNVNEAIKGLNNIFEELKIKIGQKEWYNNIAEKYNKNKKNKYKLTLIK
jgi:hypothetical protein